MCIVKVRRRKGVEACIRRRELQGFLFLRRCDYEEDGGQENAAVKENEAGGGVLRHTERESVVSGGFASLKGDGGGSCASLEGCGGGSGVHH